MSLTQAAILVGAVLLSVGATAGVCWLVWGRRAPADAAPAPIPSPAQVEAEKKQVAAIAQEAAADQDPEKTLKDLMEPR